jgi:hypothetical protein
MISRRKAELTQLTPMDLGGHRYPSGPSLRSDDMIECRPFRRVIPMRRREFITLLGGATTALPFPASAQLPKQMRRIGVLMPFAADDPEITVRVSAFTQALQDLGWTVGRNVRIDYRWSGGDTERMRSFAAELVATSPDVIVAKRQPGHGGIATSYQNRANRIFGSG